MQGKISYFVMGLSAAYLLQTFFRRRAAAVEARRIRVTEERSGNVIDLMAWRRDMTH